MNRPCALLCATALAVAVPAQNMTSPPGHLATEGGGNFADLANAMSGMYAHVVHVDDALRQYGAHSIRKLYLRRDGTAATNAAYAARTLPVQVQMAQADFSQVINAGAVEDNVLRLTPWQTVFADRPVSLPSFVTKPTTAPAPWSIALTLDTPYAYQPTSALAIYVRIAPSAVIPPANYPIDATAEPSESTGFFQTNGAGCVVNGSMLQLSGFVANYGDPRTQSFLGVYMAPGIPSTPWVVGLGLSGTNLAFGGCMPLRTSAEVVVPMGPTDANGHGRLAVSFPHQASLIGRTLHLQGAQPWAGNAVPIALTTSGTITYQGNPVLPPHAISVSWSSSSSFGTGHAFYRGGTTIFGLDW